MITFKGSQKEFFKTYPLNMRDLNEIYELENSNGKTQYQFIGGLGEKCFKRIKQSKTKSIKSKKLSVTQFQEELKRLDRKINSLRNEVENTIGAVYKKLLQKIDQEILQAEYSTSQRIKETVGGYVDRDGYWVPPGGRKNRGR